MSLSSQENCGVRSVGGCDLVKSSYKSDVDVVEAEFRVRVREMGAGVWCSKGGLSVLWPGRGERWEGRVYGGVGFCFLRVEALPSLR